MEQKQKNNQTLLIVLVVVLIVLVAGIGVYLLYHSKTKTDDPSTTAAALVSEAETTAAATEVTTQEETTAAPEEDAQWIGIYKAYLTDRVKAAEAEKDPDQPEDYSPAHFSLIFLDGDTVPELVVSEDFYHAASATLVIIENGKTKTFENIGSNGGFQYKEKQGIVVSGYDGSGVSSRTVFRLENGRLNEIWAGSENAFYEDNTEYYFGHYENQTKVTEAEYRKAYDQYIPTGLTATLRDNAASPPMTGKNVEAYFKALADRESVPTVRAYSEMSFSGIVSEKQTDYYDDTEYNEIVLDTPMVVQFEDDEFPALISSVRITDDNVVAGSRLSVKGHPVKEREFVSVY